MPVSGRSSGNRDDLLLLAESRLRAVETTLANIGAPTHDAEGARLNANGRLVDWLAGRRSEGWIGPDPMREKDEEIGRLRKALESIASMTGSHPVSARQMARDALDAS
jgi:hypothetical protein